MSDRVSDWRGDVFGRLLVAVFLVIAVSGTWHNVFMVGFTWTRAGSALLTTYFVFRLMPFAWRAMREYNGAF